jgi:hypothetical protein
MPRAFVNPNFNYEPAQTAEPIDLSEVTSALEEVKKAIERKEAPDSVEVENIDFIKKYLREELSAVVKAVQAIDIPEPSKEVKVSNFPEPAKHPDSVKVNNLSELGDKLARLLEAVQGLNVNPVVNLPAPIVNIPEQPAPIVNIPQSLPPMVDLDISSIISALQPLRLLSRDPNKPITVRMSDGRHFIDALTATLKENGERLATVVSTSYGLTKEEYMAAQKNLIAQNVYKNGMEIPYHNSQVIDETDADNVSITYKLDGTTVATKTIAKAGSVTTITVA